MYHLNSVAKYKIINYNFFYYKYLNVDLQMKRTCSMLSNFESLVIIQKKEVMCSEL